MLPSKASITPHILLLFTDILSPGFSNLFRNKSFIYNKKHKTGIYLGPVTIWGTKNLTEQSSNTGEDQKCPPVPFPDYL
jgi:hypothetical protein